MVFNSDTYYANKYARSAWEYLAQARDVKARAARGEAYAWEIERQPRLIEMARRTMHLSVIFRRISNNGKRLKRKRRSPGTFVFSG